MSIRMFLKYGFSAVCTDDAYALHSNLLVLMSSSVTTRTTCCIVCRGLNSVSYYYEHYEDGIRKVVTRPVDN
jgi:hypothetical protein